MPTSALDLTMSTIWAITPDALQNIARISARGNEDWDVLAGKLGKPMEYTFQTKIQNGVAILPLNGPIFPKANLMTQHSGATSLELMSHDLATALENEEVHSILLDVNSPGGVAFGPAEFAEQVRAANSIKPVVAYVSGMACSAAYWIASAAGEVVAHKSAYLGSIGVVRGASYQTEPDQYGEMNLEIVSSHAANKRHDASTEEGLQKIRSELDKIEEVFHADVTQYRSITREKLLTDFGTGGVLIAGDAVRVGMADRLGSFEDLLVELQNSPRQSSKGDFSMTKTNTTGPETENGYTQVQYDEAVNQARSEGYADGLEKGKEEGRKDGVSEGQKAERDRIQSIEDNALPGYESIVAEAKADGTSTGTDVAAKIVQAQKQQGSTFINSLEQEAAAQPAIEPSASNAPAATAPNEDPSLSPEERLKAQYSADAELQKEFKTFESFSAYERNKAKARVKSTTK